MKAEQVQKEKLETKLDKKNERSKVVFGRKVAVEWIPTTITADSLNLLPDL